MEVKLVEFDNKGPRTRLAIRAFLDSNYQTPLDWECESTVFLVLLCKAIHRDQWDIIGVCAFGPYGEQCAHIHVLFVAEEWRRRGFGTHMLREVSRRGSNVTLSITFDSTHLLRFYSRYAEPVEVDADRGIIVMALTRGF